MSVLGIVAVIQDLDTNGRHGSATAGPDPILNDGFQLPFGRRGRSAEAFNRPQPAAVQHDCTAQRDRAGGWRLAQMPEAGIQPGDRYGRSRPNSVSRANFSDVTSGHRAPHQRAY